MARTFVIHYSCRDDHRRNPKIFVGTFRSRKELMSSLLEMCSKSKNYGCNLAIEQFEADQGFVKLDPSKDELVVTIWKNGRGCLENNDWEDEQEDAKNRFEKKYGKLDKYSDLVATWDPEDGGFKVLTLKKACRKLFA